MLAVDRQAAHAIERRLQFGTVQAARPRPELLRQINAPGINVARDAAPLPAESPAPAAEPAANPDPDCRKRTDRRQILRFKPL